MITRLLLAGLVIAFSPLPDVRGQFAAPQNRAEPSLGPRERRLLRERAVLYAGPSARAFVESPDFGDSAALALLMCSQSAAFQLAAFHASGGFSTLPRQRDFLRAIAQPDCRDAVALWVIQHSVELIDPDCADAFLAAPLEYALDLKPLGEAAIQRRGQRLAAPGPSQESNAKPLAWAAGMVGLVALLAWRKHRQRVRDSPA